MATLIINELDVSGLLAHHGIAVSTSKVTGENGGTMKSGKRIEDVLAQKRIVKASFIPMTGDQLALLSRQLVDGINITFSVGTGAAEESETMTAMECLIPTVGYQYAAKNSAGVHLWTVDTITFEEA